MNPIERTLLATEPALTRHLCGETKPAFETRKVAAFSAGGRILSAGRA